jgi:hypothetical protein
MIGICLRSVAEDRALAGAYDTDCPKNSLTQENVKRQPSRPPCLSTCPKTRPI